MWKWIFDNIKGVHQQKKNELQNDDEYFEFMIEDFNRRLQFSFFIGSLLGVIVGVMAFITVYQGISIK